MEVKIKLNGIKAKDGAKVLTGAKIRGDGKCDIQTENIEISGNAELLTDMELGEVMQKTEEALQELDSSSTEYASLSQIVQTERTGDRRELLKKIGIHIGMFTEGVLQNIVSDVMCGKR